MKKVTTIAVLLVIIVLAFCSGVLASSGIQKIEAVIDDSLKITYNGQDFQPRESDGSLLIPIIYKNRTYLPLSALCDLIGVDVKYDGKTKEIALSTKGGKPDNVGNPDTSNLSQNSIDILSKNITLINGTTGEVPFTIKYREGDESKAKEWAKTLVWVSQVGTITNDVENLKLVITAGADKWKTVNSFTITAIDPANGRTYTKELSVTTSSN